MYRNEGKILNKKNKIWKQIKTNMITRGLKYIGGEGTGENRNVND